VTDEARRDRRDLRRPSPRIRRNRVIAAGIAAAVFVALLVGAIFVFAPHPEGAPVAESPTPSATPTPSGTPTPRPDAPLKLTFDRRTFSIDDPSSLWVVVNKLRPLNPLDYSAPDLVSTPVPHVNDPTLRQEAADQIVAMFAQYTAETGNQMQAQSAYRSYSVQVNVYNGWVNSLGQAGADQTSARPGHSEHQTGLAMDISAVPAQCALDQCFADTNQGQWLAANAYKWGFILRYPNGLTNITGYEFEPWHYRYVGIELATEMHNTGIQTLEEFFGLPPAPDYAG
jgi:D-alanyl-D-alanine carboxypeptidase